MSINGIKYTGDLLCPIGKYALIESLGMLECTNCGAKFPVKEGIPMLLIDDAVLPEGVKDYHDLKCFKDSSRNL